MSDPTPGTPRTRKPVIVVLIAVTVAVTVSGAVLIGLGVWRMASSAPGVPEPPQRIAVEESTEAVAPIPAGVPHTLRIPVIRFEAPALPLALDGAPTILPPTKGDAYWLEEYGAPGADSSGTVYLAGHSSADGTAVFDPLIDRGEQASALQIGDEILVDTDQGTVVYHIQALERHPKTELADIENLWTSSPGRLVIITCFYDGTSRTAPDNFVVYARIAPASAR